MEAGPGATGDWIRRRLPPTAILCFALLALATGLVPRAYAPWASNLLQLALATAAAVCCARAAARDAGLPRSFWLLVGAGMALWALAQGLWTLGPVLSDSRPLLAVRDVLFVSSAAPLIAACVVRPDRPRLGALGLAADVGVVSVLALFVYVYFPVAYQALGAANPYQGLSPVFYNPQRLMLLGGLLWLLRGATGAWRRLYDELALAMVVFHGGGVLSNLAVFAGSYRPGMHDLPWTLPFLWIALAARDFQPQRHETAQPADTDAAAWQARDWQDARRGNVVAVAAVVLVPAVHLVATLVGSPPPAVASLRNRIALVGTLLVGVLYLARQLRTLRRAEATQSAREQRFRALVENSADAIGVLDPGGRFSYLSASTERVTGYRPDELAGTSPLALVHPDDLDLLRGALAGIASRPRAAVQGLLRYRHKDGHIRHGEIEAVNRFDDTAVAGMVLLLRDSSERQRAQEERERSLSLLEATLESTADGILVVDREGRVTRFNQKFAVMWRLPEDVAASRDDARVLGWAVDQLQEPAALLDGARPLDRQPSAESHDTLRTRDGRVFERFSQPQRLADEVVGRVWSFRDVTERARAEQATARLVAVIEATPDFVGMADASGRVLYVNRAGRLMLGLEADESLAERHIAEFHPARAAALVLEEAIPAALRQGAWSGESFLRHSDGHEIPVLQVVLAHRSAGGEVDFLSTIARDISERMRAEGELRRSHTLAALGSLVAGVAHEVRNPLFGISSTLDAFEARFSPQQDQRGSVQACRQQLDRLGGLMNDLLEYGKPTDLELVDCRLEDVVAPAVAFCSPLAERASVGVEPRLADDLPPLRVDRKRLTQVFQNLVENALLHSPAGARVDIAAELVRRDGTGFIECAIEDSGPGFRDEDLPHVFEPFFVRRKGKSGLALAIAHRIVQDHGGSLVARNREPGGTSVLISLPTATAAGAGR